MGCTLLETVRLRAERDKALAEIERLREALVACGRYAKVALRDAPENNLAAMVLVIVNDRVESNNRPQRPESE